MEYYTPDIEDIHVGYECERESNSGRWYKDIIEEIQLTSSDNPFQKIISDVANKALRVPYLNAEQIEKEGWDLLADYKSGYHWIKIPKIGNSIFLHYNDKKWLFIKQDPLSEYELTIQYSGECKDINQFRKICKMLNINGK